MAENKAPRCPRGQTGGRRVGWKGGPGAPEAAATVLPDLPVRQVLVTSPFQPDCKHLTQQVKCDFLLICIPSPLHLQKQPEALQWLLPLAAPPCTELQAVHTAGVNRHC